MSIDDVLAEHHVLDDPPEEWRSIVELAAFMAQVPMATVNILTDESQHQISAVGFDAAISRREDSMCRVAVESGEAIVVEDARVDPRFQDNPFVTGALGSVRFYASTPLRLPSGDVIGTLCVFDEQPRAIEPERQEFLHTLADRIVDVLGLAQRNRELQESLRRTEVLRDELRRSNDHLSAFAGQVSHDLAGVLSTVTMSLDVLDEQLAAADESSESVQFWVDTALRGSERMAAMVSDILAFARVGGSLDRKPLHLDAVVESVLLDLGIPADDPRVSRTPLPVVEGDATQIGSVMQNLISNALKFGGDEPVVEISAMREGAVWEVQVADRGVGIEPADVARVFEPLVRARDDVPGSGIGLATCRRIIQAHGGTIGLRPREGDGIVAWFRLPAVVEVLAPESVIPPRAVSQQPLRGA
ncbi:ATP-binding protein [Aeromicrobium sp. Leaf350]|uniref:sensor histidine kinase n=1 Tax=Aeromicrobium sp. Leaf350 TaxID=2876565 RepID=UPI001E30AEDD|nr:ATP-binding protein [Aeromicrobium sp. Leaf350]